MIIQIIAGTIVIILAILLYPFYKYIVSKAQMLGWLDILKQFNGKKKKEKSNVKKEK